MSTNQYKLNKSTPAAWRAKLGDICANLIAAVNALIIDHAAQAVINSSRIIAPAVLAIKAGASALVSTSAAFAAIAGGVVVRKAAATDMAALVGSLATAKSALWAFYIDAAGTLTTSAKTADAATHDAALALLPATPANKALIGFIVADNATGSAFVGGTTALDTASLTVTYYNATCALPAVATPTAVAVVGIEAR